MGRSDLPFRKNNLVGAVHVDGASPPVGDDADAAPQVDDDAVDLVPRFFEVAHRTSDHRLDVERVQQGGPGQLGKPRDLRLQRHLVLTFEYYYLNKKITKPKFELDTTFCKKITLYSLPFAISSLLYSIYFSIDVVMLTHISGNYATGVYNAAYKLITVLTVFYTAYTAVIFPVMSKFFKENEKILTIIYEKSIKYLMLIMIPLSIATQIYATDIVQLIYGQEYYASAQILSILIWTVCLLFIAHVEFLHEHSDISYLNIPFFLKI